MVEPGVKLLGPVEVRRLAAELDLRPTKQRGQNFVIDANTVRRIVRESGVDPGDVVVEVDPGLTNDATHGVGVDHEVLTALLGRPKVELGGQPPDLGRPEQLHRTRHHDGQASRGASKGSISRVRRDAR